MATNNNSERNGTFWKKKLYFLTKKIIKIGDKALFTPGPLNCSMTVKQAMLRDLGSRDVEFINTVKEIRSLLLGVAGNYYLNILILTVSTVK